ncbi:unnamed protein product [Brassicogethes aeneus]|uniref:DUF4806 domain-containing protein n=1 Tax=Brassicogethes aeneus TaxID=1431903 RepID=A0A9P0AVT1_BRAAE|nr:unnamed protein product [Brassicogethes aeneus]
MDATTVTKRRKTLGQLNKNYLRRVIKQHQVNTNLHLVCNPKHRMVAKSKLHPGHSALIPYKNPLEEWNQNNISNEQSRSYDIFPNNLITINTLPEFTTADSSQKIPLSVELSRWSIKNHVSQKTFNELLHILGQKRCLDEYHSLPLDCRTLVTVHNPNGFYMSTANGRYYHFGLAVGILSVLTANDAVITTEVIDFDINIDGLPLTKSSNSQFWPILGSLSNIFSEKVFVIGLFHGTEKVQSNVDLMKCFVEEYLNIQRNGIFYKDHVLRIRLDKVICDAPAKSFILGVKGHNAYFGCTKCTTEGTYIKNRVTYPETNASLRNDADFASGAYDDYYVSEYPLKELGVGLSRFPLDYMHLVCLGVMKKLISFWVRGNQHMRMNNDSIEKVNGKLQKIRKILNCNDFARLPRNISEFERFKATEFRQILLYTGPLIFKYRLKNEQFMHFLAFHCAIRILVSSELVEKYINYAEELLQYFVRNFGTLYGPENVTYNVHNLIHLSNDVRKFGPVDRFSAFKFENYLGQIKKCIKTSNKPLQQFVNRTHELLQFSNPLKCDVKDTILKKHQLTYNEPLLGNKTVKSYDSVQYKSFTLGIGLKNNHCLIDNEIFKIVRIIQCTQSNQIFLITNKYSSFESYFNEPCNSKIFGCGTVDNLNELNEIWPISGEIYVIITAHLNLQPFCVIEFTFNSQIFITAVASNWLICSKTTTECYWPNSQTNLRKLIKNATPPDISVWTNYSDVIVHGQYSTYKEALAAENNIILTSETESEEPKKRLVKVNQRYRDDSISPPPRLSKFEGKNTNTGNKENELFGKIKQGKEKQQLSCKKFNVSTPLRSSPPSEASTSSSVDMEDKESNFYVQSNASSENLIIFDIPEEIAPLPEIQLQRSRENNDEILLKISNQYVEFMAKLIEVEQKVDLILERTGISLSGSTDLLPNLPLKSVDEVKEFEDLLLSHDECPKQYVTCLKRVGGRDLGDCIKNVMNKTFTNNAGQYCSWTGKGGNYKLEGTTILKTIIDSIKQIRTESTDTDIKVKIMNWLQYAGVRHNRQKN